MSGNGYSRSEVELLIAEWLSEEFSGQLVLHCDRGEVKRVDVQQVLRPGGSNGTKPSAAWGHRVDKPRGGR